MHVMYFMPNDFRTYSNGLHFAQDVQDLPLTQEMHFATHVCLKYAPKCEPDAHCHLNVQG